MLQRRTAPSPITPVALEAGSCCLDHQARRLGVDRARGAVDRMVRSGLHHEPSGAASVGPAPGVVCRHGGVTVAISASVKSRQASS